MATVWISKYAMTGKISEHEVDGEPTEHLALFVKWPGGINGKQLFSRGNWHYTKAEAVAEAEKMRTKKIASLRKQIKKLEALTFI